MSRSHRLMCGVSSRMIVVPPPHNMSARAGPTMIPCTVTTTGGSCPATVGKAGPPESKKQVSPGTGDTVATAGYTISSRMVVKRRVPPSNGAAPVAAAKLVVPYPDELPRREERDRMTNREFFLQRWKQEYPTFVKVLRAVPPVWLQVLEKRCWLELLETGKIDWKVTPPTMSLDAMISAYQRAHSELAPHLEKLKPLGDLVPTGEG
jgi:hypothetical protein